MQWKRLTFFLLLNILVSVLTTTMVLLIWDRTHEEEVTKTDIEMPNFILPTTEQLVLTVKPEQRLQAYEVKAGETLGEIALSFNLSLDELMTLNGLSDPDEVGTGTTIFVPSETQFPENEEVLDIESLEYADIPQVEIVGIFGAGDMASERVQIRGLSSETISLAGWHLWDEDGNRYIFPQITLFANGAVDVYSGVGVDTVVSLYWRSDLPIWESGEKATIVDNEGNIQTIYLIP